jgi:hypothetical protein
VKTVTITLTVPEADTLLELVMRQQELDDYFGNKAQYYARLERLERKLAGRES